MRNIKNIIPAVRTLPSERRRPVTAGIPGALACLATLAACGPNAYPPGGQVCPVSAESPEPAACKEPVTRNAMPRNAMPRNAMPRNAMPRNGLTVESLRANERLLSVLGSNALEASVLAAEPGLLDGPYARDLVSYITSCALDPCTRIQVGDAVFEGQLGLCDGSYREWAAASGLDPGTSWGTAPPGEECLQRVSSCVLARANAVDARVLLSMRGPGLEVGEVVPVETQYREHRGTPIRSFERCSDLCLWGDRLGRNCDWSPGYVGQCVGGSVTLSKTGPDRTRIRVCAGIHGCDHRAPTSGGATDHRSRTYGGVMLAQGVDAVSFACPTNGPIVEGERTGYYSVMLAADTPGAALAADAAVNASHTGRGSYPADEETVFGYREGAFYGNIFSPPGVAPNLACVGPAAATTDQHACFGEEWHEGFAYLSDRLCAGPTAKLPTGCFSSPPGPCTGDVDGRCASLVPARRRAGGQTGPDRGFYEPCAGGSSRWANAYTVYLNHPCDLAGNLAECLSRLRDDVRDNVGLPLQPGADDNTGGDLDKP